MQEKDYLADHGIREAVIGGNMQDINLILENIVFLELLRRGYEVTVGKYGEKEADFPIYSPTSRSGSKRPVTGHF